MSTEAFTTLDWAEIGPSGVGFDQIRFDGDKLAPTVILEGDARCSLEFEAAHNFHLSEEGAAVLRFPGGGLNAGFYSSSGQMFEHLQILKSPAFPVCFFTIVTHEYVVDVAATDPPKVSIGRPS